MIKIHNQDINLKDTVTCGQIFRYIVEKDDSYTIILSDRVINIKKENDYLIVKSNIEEDLEEIVSNYFDLKRDYNLLNKELIKKDSSLKEIINACRGFRIINQPRFECIISYIISQNNGVPQIRSSVNNIAAKYGKKVIFEDKEYYLFPSAEDLKDLKVEDFRSLKVGFRDKYIYQIVQNINDKNFNMDLIDNMESFEAMKYLMNNKGIGEKVSSCILLFSYSRLDVFPVDTWVKKFMKDNYNIEGLDEIKKFTKEKFDNYTGLIIQYMFHYKRNKE